MAGRKPKKRAAKKAAASARPASVVSSSQEEAFVEVALLGLTTVAKQYDEFTTDEVWLWLSVYAPAIEPPEPRAMGAVMRAATRQGLCRPTDKTKRSTRTACHGRPVRIWLSLLRIDETPVN